MAAIEDDGGTKTANNDALSDRILRNLVGRSTVDHRSMRRSLLLRER